MVEQQVDESTKVLSIVLKTLNYQFVHLTVLEEQGINTVEELCNKTPDDILIKVRNLGKKSALDEVLF